MNTEEEQVSNCCTAQFGYPGWPDNDMCARCGEHASPEEEEDTITEKQIKEKGE